MAAMTGVRNSSVGGFGVCVPSLKVYQTWDSRDYRKKVSFTDTITTVVNGQTEILPYTQFLEPRPHIAKWARFPGTAESNGTDSDSNYPDFRYAEVLLIAAEAKGEITIMDIPG